MGGSSGEEVRRTSPGGPSLPRRLTGGFTIPRQGGVAASLIEPRGGGPLNELDPGVNISPGRSSLIDACNHLVALSIIRLEFQSSLGYYSLRSLLSSCFGRSGGRTKRRVRIKSPPIELGRHPVKAGTACPWNKLPPALRTWFSRFVISSPGHDAEAVWYTHPTCSAGV